MGETLIIDGSYGEGGGQILRTSLALAAVTGRAIRIENVRARRKNPGLAAQHLTGVRAAAAICRARVEGDVLGSETLAFAPGAEPAAGAYTFDVAAAREGGSAGAVTLVLQTVLPALALAAGVSDVSVEGGTHTDRSPPFDYLDAVWLPAVARMGMDMRLTLVRSGWYPVGKGVVRAHTAGRGADGAGEPLCPFRAEERGALRRVRGRALVANLPARIARRMADRARASLAGHGVAAEIASEELAAASPGAALVLVAEYEGASAGFTSLGRRGKRSETVADEAVAALLRHRGSGAALDRHLADQILLPAALAAGESAFTTERATSHLFTNAWVIERFGLARIAVGGAPEGPATVRVEGSGLLSLRGEPF